MLFANTVINRLYDYVYGNYGWFGVMFALMGLAFAVMAGYTIMDRRK